MIHSTFNSKKGISLFEVLMTLTLLSIMAVITIGTMSLSKQMINRSLSQSRVQGSLKRTLEIITRDLKEAQKGIDTNCANLNQPSNVCLVSPTTQPPPANFVASTAISFNVPESTNAAGATSFKTIVYEWFGTGNVNGTPLTITRKEISSSTGVVTPRQIIGYDISAVSLINDSANDPDVITIDLSANITSGTTVSQSAQVFLRNLNPSEP